jgi:hypothetical protein
MKARLVFLVLAMATVGAFALASTASATTTTTYGPYRSGSIVTYKATGSLNMGYAWIQSNAIKAYRSPDWGGTQSINVHWRVWHRNTNTASWELVSDDFNTWTVYSNEYVYDPGWTYEEARSGYFITDLTITWSTMTGTRIAQTFRRYTDVGDYGCYQTLLGFNSCSVVWMGGQYALKL